MAAAPILLRAAETCLRAHSPGASSAARLGAVAFIHRFGSTLNAHLHFHCVVIDGVFEPTAGGVVFHAAGGLDATAITQVQAQVRRRLLRGFVRRGLLPGNDAQAMAQWQHGGGFSLDASVRIEVFPLLCPLCGAGMRIIAFITDAPTLRDILAHCGEPTAPPRIAPARGPPRWDLPDAGPGGFDPHAQPPPEVEFDQRVAW